MSFVTKLVVLASLGLSIGACHIGEATEIVETYQAQSTSKTITCSSPFVAVDLSKLKACGAGLDKGHCYDKTKGGDPSQLTAPGCADTEVCVPDKILLANGKPLKACKSLGGQPGACNSLLEQQLNENKAIIPQDVCDDTERCAPCIRPDTGKVSGACAPMGVHELACTGGSTSEHIELCCHDRGTCIDSSAVPPANQGDMSADSCSKPGQVCAPATLVGGGAPTKCDLLGAPGVCIDYCFAGMLQGLKAVARGGCSPTEACIPCAVGKSQGLPGCE